MSARIAVSEDSHPLVSPQGQQGQGRLPPAAPCSIGSDGHRRWMPDFCPGRRAWVSGWVCAFPGPSPGLQRKKARTPISQEVQSFTHTQRGCLCSVEVTALVFRVNVCVSALDGGGPRRADPLPSPPAGVDPAWAPTRDRAAEDHPGGLGFQARLHL